MTVHVILIGASDKIRTSGYRCCDKNFTFISAQSRHPAVYNQRQDASQTQEAPGR
jgi:hypothetical protein